MRLKSSIKPVKQELLTIKVTPLQQKLIQAKADKYTGGNVSEWVRYASIQLEPKITDLVSSPGEKKKD